MTEMARHVTVGMGKKEVPAPDADAALNQAMSRYAEGDDRAFVTLFRTLAPRLRGFLRRMSSSPDVAEDLLQETFLRIHHARGSFAEGRAAAPWAYAIARNCYISHIRSAKHKLARSSVSFAESTASAGLEASAEESTLAREAATVVTRALQGMSEARRSAFILIRYEGMSVAEAAQVLGISEAALKVRAFHAYEVIRAALKELDNPAGNAPTGNVMSA